MLWALSRPGRRVWETTTHQARGHMMLLSPSICSPERSWMAAPESTLDSGSWWRGLCCSPNARVPWTTLPPANSCASLPHLLWQLVEGPPPRLSISRPPTCLPRPGRLALCLPSWAAECVHRLSTSSCEQVNKETFVLFVRHCIPRASTGPGPEYGFNMFVD